jgi:hypothetical protein
MDGRVAKHRKGREGDSMCVCGVDAALKGCGIKALEIKGAANEVTRNRESVVVGKRKTWRILLRNACAQVGDVIRR